MRFLVSCVLLAIFASETAFAGDVIAEEKVAVVFQRLTNPCGVAIQPETGDVFVSDSGAGRIVRIKSGQAEAVITDFPLDIYGKGPKYAIGPLGLAFINQNTLVVGGGGLADGKELLRIYTLPANSATLKANAMRAALGPLAARGQQESEKNAAPAGEGNFFAVAVTPAAIYATSNGDDNKGWVLKADIRTDGFGQLTRFLATKEVVGVDAPVAAVISPRGELVIGQMGEITTPHDSLLTFYNAKSGKRLLNLPTGLSDITALAYSPKGLLYALDFAWKNVAEGGLFRLDAQWVDGKQTVRAVKIASLEKATAMAFGPDGALYMTVLGSGEKPAGKLLVLPAGL